MTDVMQIEFPSAMTATFLLGMLLAFVGSVLLGLAVWRSGTLPKWPGALWIASAVVFYVLGIVLGQATTSSSLHTQSLGALLLAVSGGWMAWSEFVPAPRQRWEPSPSLWRTEPTFRSRGLSEPRDLDPPDMKAQLMTGAIRQMVESTRR